MQGRELRWGKSAVTNSNRRQGSDESPVDQTRWSLVPDSLTVVELGHNLTALVESTSS